MKNKIVVTLIGILLSIVSCEKDDICLADTPGTPHLIIRFFDASNTSNTKSVPNLRIIGQGAVSEYGSITTTDSIAIPLKVLASTTTFSLTSDYNYDDNGTPEDPSDDIITGNEDVITFNYTNNEVFISRACGFKNIYENLGVVVTQDSDNWIFNYSIENNIVENETNAHLYLYH